MSSGVPSIRRGASGGHPPQRYRAGQLTMGAEPMTFLGMMILAGTCMAATLILVMLIGFVIELAIGDA